MNTEALTEAVKTRVSKRQKRALEEIAAERHLAVSDITREALREFVRRKPAKAQRA